MRLLHWLTGLTLGLALAAGTARAVEPGDVTLLVSIDGFRAAYLERGITPNLTALAEDGVKGSLRPSFPSVTFPNHYTLITGRYPDHHGIVDNHFEDKTLGRVWDLGDPIGGQDPVWWTAAAPLWATAEAQGVRTASMFWPALGADAHGAPPRLAVTFSGKVAMADEPAQVLDWLRLPAAERPRFVMLYFYFVDHAGHSYGPDAPETEAVVREADAAIGVLVRGLKAQGLYERTNLVITADHGMTGVSTDRVQLLDDMVDLGKLRVVTTGATAGLEPSPGEEAAVDKALLGRHGHASCWRKGQVPARFHYGTNPRIPPILCLADLGWTLTTRARAPEWPGPNKGGHGYDPDAPDMAAVLVAHGPAFRQGIAWRKVPNVDVYPLLAKLLGVRPEPNDGSLAEVAGMLKDDGR